MKKHIAGLATILLVSGLSSGLAQRLNVPNYYLSTSPVLEPGVSAFGALTTEDGQNFKDGSYLHVYSFSADAGDQAFLTLGSDEFDTFLTVYSPGGELLDLNDDDWYDAALGYYFNSSLFLDLPESGRYTVIASGYGMWDIGQYELLLELNDAAGAAASQTDFADAQVLAVPGSHTVSLDDSLPATGEGFTGPGQLHSFTIEDDYFVRFWAGADEVDTVLLLYSADGTLIDFNDDFYPVTAVPDVYWQSEISLELTAGSYYLVVGSYSGWNAGDVQLEVTAWSRVN